jgi:hypothetical protein
MTPIIKYKWIGKGILKIGPDVLIRSNKFLPDNYNKESRKKLIDRGSVIKVEVDIETNHELIESKNETVKETIVSLYSLIKDKFAKNKKTKKEFEAQAKELMLKAEALEKETNELKNRIKETKAEKTDKEKETPHNTDQQTEGLATKQNLGEAS